MAGLDKQLLEILVCPVTGAALDLMNDDELAALNARIDNHELHQADGEPVTAPLQAALRTRDKRSAYPVDDGIPVMLPEKGIALD